MMNPKTAEILKGIIVDLHKSVEALSKLFLNTEKKFTLDGRLVGDIGEVIAENLYQIKLYPKNLPKYDAETTYDGSKVQIKATFKDKLTFKHKEGYYIGLKLNSDGSFKEIYNGPSKGIFDKFKNRKGIGETLLSFPIDVLKEISDNIDVCEKVKYK